MRETFLKRLHKKYMELKGYKWDGFTAPELLPQVQSNQVLALAQMVEELERRVDDLEFRLKDRGLETQ